jgi:hypothetical protein
MRSLLSFVVPALVAALSACEDSTPVPIGPGDQLQVAGTWAASAAEGGEFGAILFRADTADISRDMIAEGASLVLGLHPNGATSGRIFVPANAAGVPDFDEDLTGTWRIEGGEILLDHDADTFLRDITFDLEDDRLVADDLVGGVRVRLELERVAPLDAGGNPVPGPAGFEATGDLAIMESFPVQLAGSMTFENVSDETRTLRTGECWPLLRAYRPGEDEPVWDQAEEGACNLFAVREDEVAPGGLVRFESPIASAADVLDGELPDGDYRMTIYFHPLESEEIEIELGEVNLAIPR